MTPTLFSLTELPVSPHARPPRPRTRRRLRRTPLSARIVREVLDAQIRHWQRGRDPLGPKSQVELTLQAIRWRLIGAELSPYRPNLQLSEEGHS